MSLPIRLQSLSLAIALIMSGLTFPSMLRVSAQPQEDEAKKPFRVTARVFQARARRSNYSEPTDQLFKVRTASLADEEKWFSNFKKIYPGFEFALLQRAELDVKYSSRGTQLILGRVANRTLEVVHYGAHSIGDGKTSGTSLVIEVNLSFGKPQGISYAIHTVEAEDEMTYFFMAPRLRFSANDYVQFIRPGISPKLFESDDCLMIFAVSVDLDPKPSSIRTFDEKQSIGLQAEASRKVQPEVSQALAQAGIGGSVRTRVEISPDGHIAHAYIVNSSFPEMNDAVLTAVRQWEFPTTHFTSDQRPISAVLRFDFPMPATSQPKPFASTNPK